MKEDLKKELEAIERSIEEMTQREIRINQYINRQNAYIKKLISIVESMNINTYITQTYYGAGCIEGNKFEFEKLEGGVTFSCTRLADNARCEVLEMCLHKRASTYYAINAFIEHSIGYVRAELLNAINYIEAKDETNY